MSNTFQKYIELTGSHKVAPLVEKLSGIDKKEPASISIFLRPRQSLPNFLEMKGKSKSGYKPLSREKYLTTYAASESDIAMVTSFAHHKGLAVSKISEGHRIVELRGSIHQLESAFGCSVENFASADGKVFRGRSGPLNIPGELEEIVLGVFGLDNRPVATPKFQLFNPEKSRRAPTHSFLPTQLATLYDFPAAQTGRNQCIGIIELGGGYRQEDITAYFLSLGLRPPTVTAISVDGGINDPSQPESADGEVMLDIEVAGAVAPDASIAVYFAPNTDKGFLDAIHAAIHDAKNKPSVISISWGGPEDSWTAQSLKAYNELFQSAAALGVTVCAAAGDSGSSDGLSDGLAHVDFPSSSPYVVACGGTRLIANDGSVKSETVWHDNAQSATGGGISSVFEVPSYQANAKIPVSVNSNAAGRGVPDVAADADPDTGYQILVDGIPLVIGGTSAVAPLVAGLVARVNEARTNPIGFIHPKLYANPSACRDIIDGDNITTSSKKGYSARKGWDACTGLGVPVGTRWANLS